MKKRNFATKLNMKVFMICSLCKGKYDLRKCKPFVVKVFQQRSKFYLNKNYAIAASLSARNCKKSNKNAKFAKKIHPRYLHAYKPARLKK